MQWVVKNTRTIEASIVVIAFKKCDFLVVSRKTKTSSKNMIRFMFDEYGQDLNKIQKNPQSAVYYMFLP